MEGETLEYHMTLSRMSLSNLFIQGSGNPTEEEAEGLHWFMLDKVLEMKGEADK